MELEHLEQSASALESLGFEEALFLDRAEVQPEREKVDQGAIVESGVTEELAGHVVAGAPDVALDRLDQSCAQIARQGRCRRGLAPVFADFDVLLAPAATGEAPVGWNTGDSTLASPWTLMHTPTMSIPVFTGPNGLPIGAQVIAAPGADRTLFTVARWMHARLT